MFFGMETPLRGRSGGHTGAAPTVPFGQITCGRLVAFGQIARKWLFCLYGIVWKNMMEIGRGGACVPARVAPQGRIHRSSPAHNACIFGMETPLRRRSGGHTGNRPYDMTKFRINRMARMRSVMLSRLYCAVQSFKMT